MTHDHDSSIATGRTPEAFGVQAWSQGDLYPAVIYQRERYSDTGEFRSVSHVLALDGIEEEYATYADAEEVARALLGSPFFRAQWQGEQGRYFAEVSSERAGDIAEATRTGGNSL